MYLAIDWRYRNQYALSDQQRLMCILPLTYINEKSIGHVSNGAGWQKGNKTDLSLEVRVRVWQTIPQHHFKK